MSTWGVRLVLGVALAVAGGCSSEGTPAPVIEFPDAGPRGGGGDTGGGGCVADGECVTPGEVCAMAYCGPDHVCRVGVKAGCCTSAADCDDEDPSTADACDEGNACTHTSVPTGCKKADDCPDDGNPCTAKVCNEGGVCGQNPIANCNYCTESPQCEDGDACTSDECVNHKCVHASLKACCTDDATCDDGNPCTKDACTGAGECVHETLAPCCAKDSECDDGDACTSDACDGGVCLHAPSPDCCGPKSGEELMHIAFTPNVVDGVELQGSDPDFHWRESTKIAQAGPASLYFGDEAAQSYCGGGPNNAPYGLATVPAPTPAYPAGAVFLPPGASAWATFQVWLDVRGQGDVDTLELFVVTGNASPQLVWTKAEVNGAFAKKWVPVTVDLSAFSGLQIQLRFRFDVVDPFAYGGCSGAGPRVDEVAIVVADCGGTIGCLSDAECTTGNACLIGACDPQSGLCVTEVSDDFGCCETSADCVLGIGGLCGGEAACVSNTCKPAAASDVELMSFVFTDQVDGWSTTDQGGFRWREIGTNYTSADLSLYFGNGFGSSYCPPGFGGFNPPSGTAHLPGEPSAAYPTGTVAFDASGTTTLTFNVYLDVREDEDVDQITVHFDDLDNNANVVWTKDDADDFGKWLAVSIDVTDLAPFEGTLRFDFDVVDFDGDGGCDDGGTGVYFDDIKVVQSCQ